MIGSTYYAADPEFSRPLPLSTDGCELSNVSRAVRVGASCDTKMVAIRAGHIELSINWNDLSRVELRVVFFE